MAQSNLEKAIVAIKEAAADFTSLQVETYTGKIEGITKGQAKKIDWETVESGAYTKTNLNVELLMASKFELDGDAKLFISSSDVPAKVQEAHKAAVDSGAAIRAGILDFFKEKIV